jgi:hypothetical protein
MCTVTLPPAVNPIAVKYIYHIISQHLCYPGYAKILELEYIANVAL